MTGCCKNVDEFIKRFENLYKIGIIFKFSLLGCRKQKTMFSNLRFFTLQKNNKVVLGILSQIFIKVCLSKGTKVFFSVLSSGLTIKFKTPLGGNKISQYSLVQTIKMFEI